jgi:hypothetical protein
MIGMCHVEREIQIQIQNGENRCMIHRLYRKDADVQRRKTTQGNRT